MKDRGNFFSIGKDWVIPPFAETLIRGHHKNIQKTNQLLGEYLFSNQSDVKNTFKVPQLS
jgi:hypothetical protein